MNFNCMNKNGIMKPIKIVKKNLKGGDKKE
jgi:hypothetical protein